MFLWNDFIAFTWISQDTFCPGLLLWSHLQNHFCWTQWHLQSLRTRLLGDPVEPTTWLSDNYCSVETYFYCLRKKYVWTWRYLLRESPLDIKAWDTDGQMTTWTQQGSYMSPWHEHCQTCLLRFLTWLCDFWLNFQECLCEVFIWSLLLVTFLLLLSPLNLFYSRWICWLMPILVTPRRLSLRNCHEFKTRLGNRVHSTPA